MNITITPELQELINLRYPDMTPRQQANKVRGDLHKLYLQQYLASNKPPLVPFKTVPAESTPREIADRIAEKAPRIDDQNWAAIKRGVEAAQAQGVWYEEDFADDNNESRLIERLTTDFDGAVNEYRVQKSRITAFFERLL